MDRSINNGPFKPPRRAPPPTSLTAELVPPANPLGASVAPLPLPAAFEAQTDAAPLLASPDGFAVPSSSLQVAGLPPRLTPLTLPPSPPLMTWLPPLYASALAANVELSLADYDALPRAIVEAYKRQPALHAWQAEALALPGVLLDPRSTGCLHAGALGALQLVAAPPVGAGSGAGAGLWGSGGFGGLPGGAGSAGPRAVAWRSALPPERDEPLLLPAARWLLVQAPTSSGKTRVAEVAILCQLFRGGAAAARLVPLSALLQLPARASAASGGESGAAAAAATRLASLPAAPCARCAAPRWRALLVLPYHALVAEKVAALRRLLAEAAEHEAAAPSGGGGGGGSARVPFRALKVVDLGAAAAAGLGDADIGVCTVERALYALSALVRQSRLHELRCVVIDEVHMLGNAGRGAAVESLLAKLKYLRERAAEALGVHVRQAAAAAAAERDLAAWWRLAAPAAAPAAAAAVAGAPGTGGSAAGGGGGGGCSGGAVTPRATLLPALPPPALPLNCPCHVCRAVCTALFTRTAAALQLLSGGAAQALRIPRAGAAPPCPSLASPLERYRSDAEACEATAAPQRARLPQWLFGVAAAVEASAAAPSSALQSATPCAKCPPRLPDVQVIALSGTLPNAPEVQEWLHCPDATSPSALAASAALPPPPLLSCALFSTSHRPVELLESVLHVRKTSAVRGGGAAGHGHGASTTCELRHLRSSEPPYDRRTSPHSVYSPVCGDSDCVLTLACEPPSVGEQVLVFDGSVASVQALAARLAERLEGGVLEFLKRHERRAAARAAAAVPAAAAHAAATTGAKAGGGGSASSGAAASASGSASATARSGSFASTASRAATTAALASAAATAAVACAAAAKLRTLPLADPFLIALRTSLLGASTNAELRAAMARGVAFHHAGLTPSDRAAVEEAFRCGAVVALVATSTLAAGVNLPASRVVFASLRMGRDSLESTVYQQMAGRAGRNRAAPRASAAGAGADASRPPPRQLGHSIAIARSEDDVALVNKLCFNASGVRSQLLLAAVAGDAGSGGRGGAAQRQGGPHASAAAASGGSSIAASLADRPSAAEAPAAALAPLAFGGVAASCDASAAAAAMSGRSAASASPRGVSDAPAPAPALALAHVGSSSLDALRVHPAVARLLLDALYSGFCRSEADCVALCRATLSWRENPAALLEAARAVLAALVSSSFFVVERPTERRRALAVSASAADAAPPLSAPLLAAASDALLAPSSIASAAAAAGLSPFEALELYAALGAVNARGLLTAHRLHLLYLITPVAPQALPPLAWADLPALLADIARSDAAAGRVMEKIGVEPALVDAINVELRSGELRNTAIDDRMRRAGGWTLTMRNPYTIAEAAAAAAGAGDGSASARPPALVQRPLTYAELAIHRRLAAAWLLHELPGGSADDCAALASRYGVSEAALLSLHAAAIVFAGKVSRFCSALSWSTLARLAADACDDLARCSPPHLAPLMALAGMTRRRAAALHAARFTSPAHLSQASAADVAAALLAALPPRPPPAPGAARTFAAAAAAAADESPAAQSASASLHPRRVILVAAAPLPKFEGTVSAIAGCAAGERARAAAARESGYAEEVILLARAALHEKRRSFGGAAATRPRSALPRSAAGGWPGRRPAKRQRRALSSGAGAGGPRGSAASSRSLLPPLGEAASVAAPLPRAALAARQSPQLLLGADGSSGGLASAAPLPLYPGLVSYREVHAVGGLAESLAGWAADGERATAEPLLAPRGGASNAATAAGGDGRCALLLALAAGGSSDVYAALAAAPALCAAIGAADVAVDASESLAEAEASSDDDAEARVGGAAPALPALLPPWIRQQHEAAFAAPQQALLARAAAGGRLAALSGEVHGGSLPRAHVGAEAESRAIDADVYGDGAGGEEATRRARVGAAATAAARLSDGESSDDDGGGDDEASSEAEEGELRSGGGDDYGRAGAWPRAAESDDENESDEEGAGPEEERGGSGSGGGGASDLRSRALAESAAREAARQATVLFTMAPRAAAAAAASAVATEPEPEVLAASEGPCAALQASPPSLASRASGRGGGANHSGLGGSSCSPRLLAAVADANASVLDLLLRSHSHGAGAASAAQQASGSSAFALPGSGGGMPAAPGALAAVAACAFDGGAIDGGASDSGGGSVLFVGARGASPALALQSSGSAVAPAPPPPPVGADAPADGNVLNDDDGDLDFSHSWLGPPARGLDVTMAAAARSDALGLPPRLPAADDAGDARALQRSVPMLDAAAAMECDDPDGAGGSFCIGHDSLLVVGGGAEEALRRRHPLHEATLGDLSIRSLATPFLLPSAAPVARVQRGAAADGAREKSMAEGNSGAGDALRAPPCDLSALLPPSDPRFSAAARTWAAQPAFALLMVLDAPPAVVPSRSGDERGSAAAEDPAWAAAALRSASARTAARWSGALLWPYGRLRNSADRVSVPRRGDFANSGLGGEDGGGAGRRTGALPPRWGLGALAPSAAAAEPPSVSRWREGTPRICVGLAVAWGLRGDQRLYIPLPPPVLPLEEVSAPPRAPLEPAPGAAPCAASLSRHRGRGQRWRAAPHLALVRIAAFLGFRRLVFVDAAHGSGGAAEGSADALAEPPPNLMAGVCRRWRAAYLASYHAAWRALAPARWAAIAHICGAPGTLKVALDAPREINLLADAGVPLAGPLCDPAVARWMLDPDVVSPAAVSLRALAGESVSAAALVGATTESERARALGGAGAAAGLDAAASSPASCEALPPLSTGLERGSEAAASLEVACAAAAAEIAHWCRAPPPPPSRVSVDARAFLSAPAAAAAGTVAAGGRRAAARHDAVMAVSTVWACAAVLAVVLRRGSLAAPFASVEMPALRVLAEMERRGMALVDAPLRAAALLITERAAVAQAACAAVAMRFGWFNSHVVCEETAASASASGSGSGIRYALRGPAGAIRAAPAPSSVRSGAATFAGGAGGSAAAAGVATFPPFMCAPEPFQLAPCAAGGGWRSACHLLFNVLRIRPAVLPRLIAHLALRGSRGGACGGGGEEPARLAARGAPEEAGCRDGEAAAAMAICEDGADESADGGGGSGGRALPPPELGSRELCLDFEPQGGAFYDRAAPYRDASAMQPQWVSRPALLAIAAAGRAMLTPRLCGLHDAATRSRAAAAVLLASSLEESRISASLLSASIAPLLRAAAPSALAPARRSTAASLVRGDEDDCEAATVLVEEASLPSAPAAAPPLFLSASSAFYTATGRVCCVHPALQTLHRDSVALWPAARLSLQQELAAASGGASLGGGGLDALVRSHPAEASCLAVDPGASAAAAAAAVAAAAAAASQRSPSAPLPLALREASLLRVRYGSAIGAIAAATAAPRARAAAMAAVAAPSSAAAVPPSLAPAQAAAAAASDASPQQAAASARAVLPFSDLTSVADAWARAGFAYDADAAARVRGADVALLDHSDAPSLCVPADQIFRHRAPLYLPLGPLLGGGGDGASGCRERAPWSAPHDFHVRASLQARRGCVLLSLDLAQLEIRLLAHLSQCPRLHGAFADASDGGGGALIGEDVGGDFFRKLAALWLGTPLADVSGEERALAKRLCYAVVYGMGAAALAKELHVSAGEAGDKIASFRAAFPTLAAYMREATEASAAAGYAETLLHRRRYLPAINSESVALRARGARQALNSIVQGSGADLMKVALARIGARLALELPGEGESVGGGRSDGGLHRISALPLIPPPAAPLHGGDEASSFAARAGGAALAAASLAARPRARILLQIFDEVLLEVHVGAGESGASALSAALRICVESLTGAALLRVPLRVRAAIGRSWAAMRSVPPAALQDAHVLSALLAQLPRE